MVLIYFLTLSAEILQNPALVTNGRYECHRLLGRCCCTVSGSDSGEHFTHFPLRPLPSAFQQAEIKQQLLFYVSGGCKNCEKNSD